MISEEKIAAVVILYHPPENVLANIKSYYDFVDRIFVFDNTEIAPHFKDELLQLDKVAFYHDYKNEGIARRLNSAADLAINANFNWLLTMDQDTYFSKNTIEQYIQCFSSYSKKNLVALFGTEYNKNNNSTSLDCSTIEEDNLITSGMLLNLKLFAQIGEFDEKLFIDSVDHDYCIRAKLAGFSIIKFSNIFIQHGLGEVVFRSSIKTLFLVKKRKLIHSPLRCYYMYRNMLYLENKFEGANIFLVKNLRSIVKGRLSACLFYGRNASAVIKYLLLARKDYKNDNMGQVS